MKIFTSQEKTVVIILSALFMLGMAVKVAKEHFDNGTVESAVAPSRDGMVVSRRIHQPVKKVGIHVEVLVRDNNVDQALRVLKKKLQREGVFREMKKRRHYEKPSEKKAREKSENIRRSRKTERKKRQNY